MVFWSGLLYDISVINVTECVDKSGTGGGRQGEWRRFWYVPHATPGGHVIRQPYVCHVYMFSYAHTYTRGNKVKHLNVGV